jgi:hypothetical protein
MNINMHITEKDPSGVQEENTMKQQNNDSLVPAFFLALL